MSQIARLVVAIAMLGMLSGMVTGCFVNPLEKLSRDIESPKVTVREQAVVELANLRAPQAVKFLVEVLASDEELYDQAAVALVKQGRAARRTERENPVVKQVSALLGNAHVGELFRARAAWTLGEIGDRRAIPILKEAALGSLAAATLVFMTQQATEALEKLGYMTEGRAYEIPMGTLAGQLEVIPVIESLG